MNGNFGRVLRPAAALVVAAALSQLAACQAYPPAYGTAAPPDAGYAPPPPDAGYAPPPPDAGYAPPPPGAGYAPTRQPTAITYVDAPVIKATAVYRDVQVASPRQVCRQVPVDTSGNHTAGTLIGGALGGLVGNQFGKGSGNAAMTAAGAVAGALAGNAIASQNDGQVARQCRMVNDYHMQRRQDGFDVTYRYGGQVYHTHTDSDPGSTVRVRVAVTPQ